MTPYNMILTIPIPLDNFQIVWLLIGMGFGRSFGKQLDHTLQQTKFFTDRDPFWQGMIKRLLDFTHHWWIGALLWLYAPLIVKIIAWPALLPEVMWFGVGLFLDDIRDFKHVLARYKVAVNKEEEE